MWLEEWNLSLPTTCVQDAEHLPNQSMVSATAGLLASDSVQLADLFSMTPPFPRLTLELCLYVPLKRPGPQQAGGL